MFNRFRNILLIIVALVFVGGLGAVVVLTASRQSTTAPVAPTVPQVVPQAAEPATTVACTLGFIVAATPTLKCTGITLSPNNTTISGSADTRTLTAASSGGTAPVTFAWAVTSDGADKGSLSATTGTTVTWSPPGSSNLTATQTWSITATAADATGKTDASGCSVTLNYAQQQVTHKECRNNACVVVSGAGTDTCTADVSCQQTTYQHKVCLGNACSSVQCSPATSPCADSCSTNADCGMTVSTSHRECRNNACVVVTGAGADTCTSDVSCQPQAVAPPIPPSGSVEITIGSIILGAGALIVGLLLLVF